MKPTTKWLAWCFALVALAVFGSIAAFQSLSRLEGAVAERRHTYALIGMADGLLASIIDAETGERGYLLTGNEMFLQSYRTSVSTINSQLQALQTQTRIPAAQQSLAAVSPLISAKLAHMAKVIALRGEQQVTASVAASAQAEDLRLMDPIRLHMLEFDKREAEALRQREADLQSSLRQMYAVLVAVSLFSVALTAASIVLIGRQSRQHAKSLVHDETRHLLSQLQDSNLAQEQANRALQVREEMLSVTLNSIGDAVIATDAAARVTSLNPVAERLTGWTQAQASGRLVDEVFHIVNKETRGSAVIPVAAALESGAVQGLANHTVLIARDGSECDIADSCAPIRDRTSAVVGAVLVFRDVSKEYAVQQALRDGAALVQTILSTVVDGIITLHAAGVPDRDREPGGRAHVRLHRRRVARPEFQPAGARAGSGPAQRLARVLQRQR